MRATQPIVAIDGPAGSGKSTVAKLAAERSGLQFISSGALYRGVALRARREGLALVDSPELRALAQRLQFHFTTDEQGGVHTTIDGEDVTTALRQPEIGEAASQVATFPAVRQALVDKLQRYGADGGLVMEGRDIQTVVFPDADIKVFLQAGAAERARRRWRELNDCGQPVTYQQVFDEVLARDARDCTRASSPLKAAADAVSVDTDGRTIDEVVECLRQLIETWRRHPRLHGQALADEASRRGGTC